MNEVDHYLKDAIFLVEASRFETHIIWEKNQHDPLAFDIKLDGFGPTVGHIGDQPVVISIRKAFCYGYPIIIYHDTSALVNHDMIEEYLKKKCPKAVRVDGYLNKTDAMNFHDAVRHCSSLPVEADYFQLPATGDMHQYVIRSGKTGKFYFWDETGSAHGPWDTFDVAEKAFNHYLEHEIGVSDTPKDQ